MKRADTLVLAALVLVGAALRAPGLSESLVGDELFLLRIVEGRSFGEMITAVRDIESTPPLGFALSWMAGQVGDPVDMVRVPMFAAGLISIPVVYLLGLRTLGRQAGLVGAGVFTFAPTAIFYAADARDYSLVALLSACSTVALLAACERGGPWRWSVFALATAAALYSHYTVVFVLVAQVTWAGWTRRERLRELAAACAAALLLFAPWVPAFLNQTRDSAANRIETLYPLTLNSVGDGVLRLFPGEPFVSLEEVPGVPALLLLGVALAAGAVAALRRGGRPSPELWLVLLLALVTPLCAVLYSLGPQSIFLPRNLIASLPAVCVLAGAAALAAKGRLRLLSLGGVVVAMVLAAGAALSPDARRAPYDEVAERLDRIARPREPIVDINLAGGPLSRSLPIYFEHPHMVNTGGPDGREALLRVPPGGRAFMVIPAVAAFARAPVPPGFRIEERERFRGAPPLDLLVLRREAPLPSRRR